MSFRRRTLLISGVAVLAGSAAWTMLGQTKPAQRPATKTASQAAPTAVPRPKADPTSKPSGKIVATVNGEPIYESELLAGLPEDAFQEQLEDLKKAKLDRLVEETFMVQFLRDHKVTVSDNAINEGIKEFERMVKTSGCPCCGGGYENLEQFMKINAFSMQEVCRRVSCDIGLRLCVERLAQEQNAPQVLEDAVKQRRTDIEANYVQAYAIFFGDARDPAYFRDQKPAWAKKDKPADEALQRLKKGEPFEKVAKEMSADGISGPKGGALGRIRANLLGPEVEQAFRKLEPGAYSEVLNGFTGCCIVMRKKLTEEDILSVVKQEAQDRVEKQLDQEFKAVRKKARIQYGSP